MKVSQSILISDNYVPTLNRMGYMSPALDEIQAAFVNYCTNNTTGNFLDIGCGFGVATLPVVNQERHVVACDLEKKHLDVLKTNVPQDKQSFLTSMTGHFPNDITFPENTFEGVNFSMVLHFLPPQTIKKALQEIFKSLKPGGRLFMTTSSPYQRVLSSFLPLYEKKRFIEEWPGYIPDIGQYVPHRAHLLPKENIVFCINELRRLVSKFGFHILETTFFSRDGIPPDLRLEGREYSGIICEKPKASSFVFLEKNKDMLPIHAANMR